MSAMRVVLVVAILVLALLQAAAQEWSGTITQVENVVGPADVAGGDRAELDAYAKLLEQRLLRTRADLRAAPQTMARVLRGDIGTYQAELERVALARGGVVAVAQTTFVMSGQKLVVIGEGPRLVVDRTLGRAIALDGQRRDDVPLAPLPVPIALDRTAPEVAVVGTTARRIEIKAEGRKYVVLLVPDLPNPYAPRPAADQCRRQGQLGVGARRAARPARSCGIFRRRHHPPLGGHENRRWPGGPGSLWALALEKRTFHHEDEENNSEVELRAVRCP